MQIAELFYSISADGVDKVGQQIGKLGDMIQNAGKSMEQHITEPILELVGVGVKYNSQIEELETNFKVLLGSEEKALKMTKDLKDMGSATPFEITGLAQATKTLLSFGVTNENVLPMMSRLGDVSLGNTENFKGYAFVMGQINSLGRLQAGDLNQLIGRGWNPLNEITARTGETMLEVRERMRKGKVGFNEVEQALVDATSKGGKFYGGMSEGSKTLSGKISTLKDNFNQLLGQATKPLFDYIKDVAIPFVINLVEKIGKMSPLVLQIISVFALLIAGIGPLLTVLGVLVVGFGGVVTAIAGIIAVGNAVGAVVMLSIVAVLLALAEAVVFLTPVLLVLGAGFVALITKTGFLKDAIGFLKGVFFAISSVLKGDFKGAMDMLVNKLGLSKEQAGKFITKVYDLQQHLIVLKGIVIDVAKFIGAIFTGDSQKMIDLLVKKFGYSKDEAKALSDRMVELRDKAIDLYNKLKVKLIDVLIKVADKLKTVAKYIIDNRDKIIKFITVIVEVGTKVYRIMKQIKKDFNDTKKTIKDAMNIAIDNVNKFKDTLLLITGIVQTLIKKITGISFPKPPSWLTSKIPKFESGTRNFSGGWAVVGEGGPEIVNLPSGSDVFNNKETSRMTRNLNNPQLRGGVVGGGSNKVVNYNINEIKIDGKSIAEMTTISDFFNKLDNEVMTRGFSY